MCPPLQGQSARDVALVWSPGDVVEYCICADTSRWVPSVVVSASAEAGTLVVNFFDSGQLHELSLQQSDERLAPAGCHEREPPPGFLAVQSKSRPGFHSYLDQIGGVRYASLDLAWRMHFTRELQSDCSTVSVFRAEDSQSKCFTWPSSLATEIAEPNVDMAPSPSVMPMTKFAFVLGGACAAPKKGTSTSDSPRQHQPLQQALPTAGTITKATGKCSAPFVMQKAIPKWEQRVAELEGALDESRDYVKLLESELRRTSDEEDSTRAPGFTHSHHEFPERSLSASESAPTLTTSTLDRQCTAADPRTCSPHVVADSASTLQTATRTSQPPIAHRRPLPRARTPPRGFTPVRGSSTGRLPKRSSTPTGSIRSSTPSGSPPSSSARSVRSSTPSGCPPASSARYSARSGTPSGSPRCKDSPPISMGPRFSCGVGPPGKPSSGLTPRWRTSYQSSF